MSSRTGTQLKGTDVAAADSALATAISSSTDANVSSAHAAFGTVDVNGRDSRVGVVTNDAAAQRFGPAVAALARRVMVELNGIKVNTTAGSAQRVDALRAIQRELLVNGWQTYKDKATTT